MFIFLFVEHRKCGPCSTRYAAVFILTTVFYNENLDLYANIPFDINGIYDIITDVRTHISLRISFWSVAYEMALIYNHLKCKCLQTSNAMIYDHRGLADICGYLSIIFTNYKNGNFVAKKRRFIFGKKSNAF